MNNLIVETAFNYATNRGWYVFPVSKTSKAPKTARGFKDAAIDIAEIKAMFGQGKSNIGVATGRCSGFCVIDIDVKNSVNGHQSLRNAFGGNYVVPDKCLTASTPNGGQHIFVKWEDSFKVTSNIGVLDGVDLKGEGGYVVVAPSNYFGTGKYAFNDDFFDPGVASDWMREVLSISNKQTSHDKTRHPTNLDIGAVEGFSAGARNDSLFRWACRLKLIGFDQGMVVGFVQHASSLCIPPFPTDEALKVVDSAFSYPDSSGRSILQKDVRNVT